MRVRREGLAGKIAKFFINSKLTPLIIITSILLGMVSILAMPREEDPQIIVPMVDVFVRMPGASSKEVEQLVSAPMEKLLWEIPGVKYVYSTSSPGMSLVIVRFKVGENEEKAIVRLQSKLAANYDKIPMGASMPLIKPRSINDVPVMALTFWSKKVDHYTLRRVAVEIENIIKKGKDVSATRIIGGEQRKLNIYLDPVRLAGFHLDITEVAHMIQSADVESHSGDFPSIKGEIIVHTGGFLKTKQDVENLVVGIFNNKPVYLRDIAKISDGPGEPSNYVFFGSGPAAAKENTSHLKTDNGNIYPAVTLTIAKRKGSNAVTITRRILKTIQKAKGSIIPDNIHVTVTRNYGRTANDKANELFFEMAVAIISVTLLIWFVLGHRESGIVAIAIPVTLALALTVFYLDGYTLNRITLFALIFSIGILVDDAIVVVENIVRHFRLPENKNRSLSIIAVEAVDEVGNPTILATLTVICAILPMAFVGGLMGPYMRPMPVGASTAMFFSLFIAFTVTPWASIRLLKRGGKNSKGKGVNLGQGEREDFSTRLYRKVMEPLIHHKGWKWLFLISIVVMLILACSMVGLKLVKVKMLPLDNKSEFQVIIDTPESATIEETTKAAMEMGEYLKTVNEVKNYEIYSGTTGPINFNGLIRHYYLRRGSNVADIQVNLVGKEERKDQSHAIAKRVRPALAAIGKKFNASVKIAEVPPGPPVIATLVAEVYGPDYKGQIKIAKKIKKIFNETNGVVDVDWYVEYQNTRYNFKVDKERAALHGISTAKIAETLKIALSGGQLGLLHNKREKEDVPIILRLPMSERAGIKRLETIKIAGRGGHLIPLSSLVIPIKTKRDRSIYHKNLMPVVYVTGDVAGVMESPVYAILAMKNRISHIKIPGGYTLKQHMTGMPTSDKRFSIKWGGEWQITYEVFRDMGIAFAVVLVLIFILVVGWFKSFTTPLVIMAAIPFSLIGILPAHYLAGAFFTATSMIGFIAGAGIVVRNSIILVDFIELRLEEGMPLDLAVIDAGAVRFRPMLLTAAAVIVGASVILFDPIFQGLAISLMAGEVASLLFSRMAVPILYYMDKRFEHVISEHHRN